MNEKIEKNGEHESKVHNVSSVGHGSVEFFAVQSSTVVTIIVT